MIYNTWQTMAHQGFASRQIIEEQEGRLLTIADSRQTEGMVHLADSYGLRKIATAMHSRPDRVSSFYLSSYR